MSTKRFTEEFKIEAVKQVIERGHAVAEVAGRLGASTHSPSKRYSVLPSERESSKDQQAELRRLKPELKRLSEECDILKKAAVSSTGQCNSSDLMALLKGKQC